MKRKHLLRLDQFTESQIKEIDLHLNSLKREINYLEKKIERTKLYKSRIKIPELLQKGTEKEKDQNEKLIIKKNNLKHKISTHLSILNEEQNKRKDVYEKLKLRRYHCILPWISKKEKKLGSFFDPFFIE